METSGVFRVSEQSSYDSKKFEGKLSHSMHGEQSGVDALFWIAVVASQLVGIICTILVVYWCTLYGGFAWDSDPELQFFVHPLLMVLGLIIFYGDAIMIYRVLSFLPKWILKWIHAALHLGAIVMSSVGLVAVFENHRRKMRADMYSLHSWVGIGTFSFFCLQYVGSFITFLVPGLPPRMRAIVMPFHTFFGIGLFILAVASAQTGLTQRLFFTSGYSSGNYTAEGAVGNSLGICLIIFAFLVVFITTRSLYKRRPLPSEIAPKN